MRPTTLIFLYGVAYGSIMTFLVVLHLPILVFLMGGGIVSFAFYSVLRLTTGGRL